MSGGGTAGPWPARVVDPHVHQWDPFTTPRHASRRARLLRPLPRVPAALSRVATRSEREFVADPHHVLKPYLPADYLADTGEVPVTSLVHVEAAWQGDPWSSVDETRWVSALPLGRDGAPDLGAVVVHVDPRWPEAAAILDAHLAASPRVRGVRHSAAHHPDPGVRDFEAPGVLVEPGFLRGFDAVAERGLSFELWVYSHQLPDAVALAARFPETTFVLDHHATPVGLLGPRGEHTGTTAAERRDLLARWRDDLAALAALPHVVAKHSGLGMPVLGGTPPRGPRRRHRASRAEVLDAVAPLVRHVHDCFGPERTMWASNYPVDKPVLALPDTARLLLDVLGADAEPQQLFHDVAARTYRTGPGGPAGPGDPAGSGPEEPVNR